MTASGNNPGLPRRAANASARFLAPPFSPPDVARHDRRGVGAERKMRNNSELRRVFQITAAPRMRLPADPYFLDAPPHNLKVPRRKPLANGPSVARALEVCS